MDGNWEVFETPDVDDGAVQDGAPEGSSSSRRKESDLGGDEGVDSGPVPEPERVFEVFAGKRFISDHASRRAPELVGAVPESPFERFNRLQAEVADLLNDLAPDTSNDGEADDQKEFGNAHSDAYNQLVSGVRQMSAALGTLGGDGLGALLSNEEAAAGERETAQALNRARVEALRERLQAREDDVVEGKEKASVVSFDLMYAGREAAGSSEGERQGALEARVRALETILGDERHGERPLMQVVEALEKHVALLDEAKLTHLTQKAKVLNAELENSSRLRQRRRAAVAASGEDNASGRPSTSEVSELVQKLDQCEAVAKSLPGIVDRLQTAQEIHQHNANMHMRLEEIDRVQAELEEAARLDHELLETLQASLAENMERMQAHLEASQ